MNVVRHDNAAPEGAAFQFLLATLIGFEPTVSTVTGWRVRPLHHRAAETGRM